MSRTKKTRNPNGRSSIYLGSDGLWHGRVTVGLKDDGTPDRRHTKSKDKQKVIDKVKELEKARDSGNVRKAGKVWTVRDWLTHWVETIAAPTVRPNTLSYYRVAVYNHLIPGLGAHKLTKLEPEHIERFYVALGKKKTRKGTRYKPSRVVSVHRTLRTALGEALHRKHITENPAKLAKPPRVPEEEVIPFTREEATRILEAAQGMRTGARFVIALTLGLRKGEALGLQWKDIDLERRTMKIRRSIQRLNWQHGCPDTKPCGRKYAGHCPDKHSGGAVATEVKSKAGKRTIGLPTPLVEVLKEHKAKQQRERERAGNLWTEGDWVFTNRLGGVSHPRVDHDSWKVLLKRAKVRDARLHDARHTAATMLIVLKVPTPAVMKLMGWSTASMATVYQHIDEEVILGIADDVGGAFWTQKKPQDGEGDGGAAGVPVPA